MGGNSATTADQEAGQPLHRAEHRSALVRTIAEDREDLFHAQVGRNSANLD
jgi:hypothetical protein